MDLGYYNGKIAPLEEMMIPMNDRVVYFGDGIYEATMVFNGVVQDFEDHLDRFSSSLKKIYIQAPMERDALKETLLDFARRGDVDTWYMLYWSATRGTAPRRHAFPENTPSNLIITLIEDHLERPKERVRLITFEDRRFEYCDVKTLNLIPSCLASQAAKEAGCHEAVFHRGEIVTECSHSNISILKDGTFQTAPADRWILPGIGRKNLIRASKAVGIPVLEKHFTLNELFDADEIILSSSSGQFLPARELDGKKVGGRDQKTLSLLWDELARYINGQYGFEAFDPCLAHE